MSSAQTAERVAERLKSITPFVDTRDTGNLANITLLKMMKHRDTFETRKYANEVDSEVKRLGRFETLGPRDVASDRKADPPLHVFVASSLVVGAIWGSIRWSLRAGRYNTMRVLINRVPVTCLGSALTTVILLNRKKAEPYELSDEQIAMSTVKTYTSDLLRLSPIVVMTLAPYSFIPGLFTALGLSNTDLLGVLIRDLRKLPKRRGTKSTTPTDFYSINEPPAK